MYPIYFTLKALPISRFTTEDAEAIDAGYKKREAACILSCTNAIEDLNWDLELEVLSWLIATGKLNIKLAMRAQNTRPGIYHEKLGIIKDFAGNFITFSNTPAPDLKF